MDSVPSRKRAYTRHGGKGTRLYGYWKDLKRKKVPVCEEWGEFTPFRDWAIASGYQEGMSLWRKDLDGILSPDNCFWGRGFQVHPRLKHGGKRTRLYSIWKGMRKRCRNPKDSLYQWYGGRGIQVCPEWDESFEAFRDWAMANGYADNLTIERRDYDKGYQPDNCEWITTREQHRNTSRNRRVTAFGETKLLIDWSRDDRCRVPNGTLLTRLDRGWDEEEAITTPRYQRPPSAKRLRSLAFQGGPPKPGHDERWSPIPGWPAYEASDYGRVRSYWRVVRAGFDGKRTLEISDRPVKILKCTPDDQGRPKVTLVDGTGKSRQMRVARLVLMAHVNLPAPGQEACHFPDPNPANCTIGNLRWDSRAENIRDKARVDEMARRLIDEHDEHG